jgi:predicted RNA-binding Zn ribbon-like protein
MKSITCQWCYSGYKKGNGAMIGTTLCLEFANTIDWHASDHPEELLKNYADLVEWARRAGVLNDRASRRLLRAAARRPHGAEAALRRARALRDALYNVFVAEMAGRAPAADDLAVFNRALAAAMRRAQLTRTPGGFVWDWRVPFGDADTAPPALDGMLWPVARAAADLLLSPERAHIGQCADDRGCGALFLDTSKNHTRRWCAMRDCGNRAKARRHYRRAQDKVDAG